MKEPQIHGSWFDGLPENHKYANQSIHCGNCNTILHAFNNEAMDVWVESDIGAHCLPCFDTIWGEANGEIGLSEHIGDGYELPRNMELFRCAQNYRKILDFVKSLTRADTLQSIKDILKDQGIASNAKKLLKQIGEA